ncbi:hypothetical protein FHS29_001974 [Saccharothrix tamanrassetensis]|uniref:Uncharacterized protein n=1 Tax=Saccharothrix tamanrassetensis TaxID=1051531 RepID=A0A841CEK5_9PSEU|nr:hypothetical protein [Saccharothrix tamanrassetensis]MBB5955393.1 hypothetical protein [Saccharothrix tamanrassetensis]
MDALHHRIGELERQVAALAAQVRGNRPLPADAARPESSGGPRTDHRLDTVYRAEVHGYVAVYFVTGRVARVRLLVGTDYPPTRLVGMVHGSGDSYAGTVVRPGEYWLAESNNKRPNLRFNVHFTPLF